MEAPEPAKLDDEDAREAEYERRVQEQHGCCCSCCSLKAEAWVMVLLDCFIFVGGMAEFPPKEAPHLRVWFLTYLFGVVVPSACCWLYALFGKGGWPRRLLCRYICYKIPMFFACYLLFFTWP